MSPGPDPRAPVRRRSPPITVHAGRAQEGDGVKARVRSGHWIICPLFSRVVGDSACGRLHARYLTDDKHPLSWLAGTPIRRWICEEIARIAAPGRRGSSVPGGRRRCVHYVVADPRIPWTQAREVKSGATASTRTRSLIALSVRSAMISW